MTANTQFWHYLGPRGLRRPRDFRRVGQPTLLGSGLQSQDIGGIRTAIKKTMNNAATILSEAVGSNITMGGLNPYLSQTIAPRMPHSARATVALALSNLPLKTTLPMSPPRNPSEAPIMAAPIVLTSSFGNGVGC